MKTLSVSFKNGAYLLEDVIFILELGYPVIKVFLLHEGKETERPVDMLLDKRGMSFLVKAVASATYLGEL